MLTGGVIGHSGIHCHRLSYTVIGCTRGTLSSSCTRIATLEQHVPNNIHHGISTYNNDAQLCYNITGSKTTKICQSRRIKIINYSPLCQNFEENNST